jgi:hypothetical protein
MKSGPISAGSRFNMFDRTMSRKLFFGFVGTDY